MEPVPEMPDLENAYGRLAPAKPLLILFAAFACCATLAGCGKPDTPATTAAGADKLCAAIKDSGYTQKCSANPLDGTVGIVAGTDDDEAARNLCAAIAGKMKPLNAGLTGQGKLQIFSPYRDDKPLAACTP
jgi:hypothetical protein